MYVTLSSMIPPPYNLTLSISASLQELWASRPVSHVRSHFDKHVRPQYDKHIRSRYDDNALSDYNKVPEPEQTRSNMSTSNPAITFAIRGSHALFSVVVFGFACTLIKGHHLGSLPSTLSFAAFVGGLSFIGALLGVASHWISVLQGHMGLLIDSAIAGVNLAGGIVRFPLP